MKDECFQMNFISDEINLEGRPEPLSYSQSSAMSSEVEIIQEHVGSIANYLSSLRPVSTFIQEPGFGDILKEGRSSIVRWSEIVEPNTILKETYDLKSIGELFKPPSLSLSGLKWLAARRLIRNSVNCSSCHSSCILVRRNMLPDRYEWECPCGQKISVRSGSIFRDCGLSISRIVGLMYCFCMGYSVHLVVPRNETNGKAIATKWYQLFREISQMLDVPDKSAKNAFSQFISYIAKHYPVEHQT
ncbi:hypothetical protein AB6A40_009994 [Gnathostoma spinigerum]|uniref:Uncharacterized protein n=1 Tax=Gnathostoma spinigerum TaxID=75299 RepID=A0ABD6ETI4_9BILA